jgi:hypothetical protein
MESELRQSLTIDESVLMDSRPRILLLEETAGEAARESASVKEEACKEYPGEAEHENENGRQELFVERTA